MFEDKINLEKTVKCCLLLLNCLPPQRTVVVLSLLLQVCSITFDLVCSALLSEETTEFGFSTNDQMLIAWSSYFNCPFVQI